MISEEYIENLKSQFGNIDDILKAIEFASAKHKGQYRDDGSEYIVHPLRVAELTRTYKPSKNAKMLYISAVLHDTLEDTYTSYRELNEAFGKDVASLVMELTTAPNVPHILKGGKAEYLSYKMEHMTSYALFIKLCDRLDNLRDNKYTKPDKQTRTKNDTRKILDYLYAHRNFTESQKRIAELIEEELKK